MRFASVLSVAPTTADAAADLCEQLLPKLPDGADLAFVTATPEHVAGLRQVSRVLREVTGCRVVLGGTSAGVLHTRRELETGPALGVLAGRLPDAGLSLFSHDQISAQGNVDGKTAFHRAIGLGPNADPPKLIVLLTDPFTMPTVRLLPTLQAAYPKTPVIGGRMLSGRRRGANRLILNDAEFTGGAVGLAITGQLDVVTTVSCGARPVDQPVVITDADRMIVKALGGRPAYDHLLTLYHRLPPADQARVRDGDLLVGRVIHEHKRTQGPGDFLVRRIRDIDERTGHLAIDDRQTRPGQTIQFFLRDPDAATLDLKRMLDAQRVHGPAAAALAFTSRRRGTHLFQSMDHDADTVADALGDIPFGGAIVDGEIGPIDGQNLLHRHALTMAVLRGKTD